MHGTTWTSSTSRGVACTTSRRMASGPRVRAARGAAGLAGDRTRRRGGVGRGGPLLCISDTSSSTPARPAVTHSTRRRWRRVSRGAGSSGCPNRAGGRAGSEDRRRGADGRRRCSRSSARIDGAAARGRGTVSGRDRRGAGQRTAGTAAASRTVRAVASRRPLPRAARCGAGRFVRHAGGGRAEMQGEGRRRRRCGPRGPGRCPCARERRAGRGRAGRPRSPPRTGDPPGSARAGRAPRSRRPRRSPAARPAAARAAAEPSRRRRRDRRGTGEPAACGAPMGRYRHWHDRCRRPQDLYYSSYLNYRTERSFARFVVFRRDCSGTDHLIGCGADDCVTTGGG